MAFELAPSPQHPDYDVGRHPPRNKAQRRNLVQMRDDRAYAMWSTQTQAYGLTRTSFLTINTTEYEGRLRSLAVGSCDCYGRAEKRCRSDVG